MFLPMSCTSPFTVAMTMRPWGRAVPPPATNEGSFGLLMDPMNGAADIESRTLRLVSNYGFLEEPSLLIRATRIMARLGWEMDHKTNTRYTNARDEGVIEYLSAQARR